MVVKQCNITQTQICLNATKSQLMPSDLSGGLLTLEIFHYKDVGMGLASYVVCFAMPFLYVVVCAGTINFVVVPNASRIGPIEPK